MKTCIICDGHHNHDYCPFCGGITYLHMGKWRVVNHLGMKMGRALPRKREDRGMAIVNAARPSIRLVKRSIGL